MIIIKKLISRQIIQRIPKSNILAQLRNNQEQCIEMETLHNTPRIIKETNSTLTLFNHVKHNKNIINAYGLFIIGVIFCIFFVIIRLSRLGWISQSNVNYHLSFASLCCAPVILATIYFMRNPKHLISVLQDHNLM